MIRPFSAFDLDHILEIERQAFPKSPYDWATFINLHCLYPETFWVDVETTLNQGEDLIRGYIIFSEDGHIISIAVHPLWRRKEIGKKLLERVIKYPRMKKVWAEVRKSNKGAQAFYLRMGFRVVGRIPGYYGDEDALLVRLGGIRNNPLRNLPSTP